MSIDRKKEIFLGIREIFRQVLRQESLDIELSSSAPDVPGWDSLTHVSLILRIERDFGMRFSSREVDALRTVEDLVALVASRHTK